MKINAVLIAALLSISTFAAPQQAQNAPLLEKARQAYVSAQALEASLDERPENDRSRDEYLKVINAYQRVILITPHTAYADDSLIAIARLYEETKNNAGAIKTLKFLIHEYPSSPFKDAAERDIARLSGVPPPKAGLVDNIRYWEAQNSVRVVVDVGGDVTFNQGDAKDPDRVFIDISPAKLHSTLIAKQWPVKSGLLRQIRVGQYDISTVRVVLDVVAIARVTSFTLRDPDRLIIDVLPKPADAPRISGSQEIRGASPEKIIVPAKATNAGARSLVRSLGLKLSRVVIDAGHGGHDTGTIGQRGYAEKELVLDVARRLKDLIETELGAEVVMTRSDDSFVPLESRTAIANQQQADMFISIHANSSAVRAVRGVETYFLNFTSSREALETASRENATSERSIHELQDLVKKIMLREKVDESRELARYMNHALAARKGSGTDRGVKQAPFVVLIGANMPSILAEVCFISNPQDEKFVKAPQNRQAIAESLFEGVRSYAQSLSGTKTAKTQDKIQE